MAKLQMLQSSFTSGELTPDLMARNDFSRYSSGCRRLKNFLVQAHGGAAKRPGFNFLGEVPGEAALVPFVFNTEQSYCLVFGDKWLRICTEEGFIVDETGQPLQIASPYSLAEARQLSWAQSGDVLFLACRGIPPQKLNRLGHQNWKFETVDFMPDITAPTWTIPDRDYEEIEYFVLRYPANTLINSANYQYVPTPLYTREIKKQPIEIEGYAVFYNRAKDSAGNISPALRNTLYTYYVTAINKENGRESLTSVKNQVTGPASNNWQVGDYIRLQWKAVPGASEYRIYKGQSGSSPGLMATTTNTYFDDINILPNYAQGLRTTKNPFIAKEGEEGLGREYPGVVCFFEQRLVYASSINKPQTIWLSNSGEYNNFSTHSPIEADDAIEISIASNEVSPLQWMVAMRSLMAGGSGMEWEITSSDGGAFSAGNARAIPQSRRGSSQLKALVIGSTILHVTRSGREIRDFQYDFGTDSYSGNDKSILASHLFEKHRIVDWDYQALPSSIIWLIREDGLLLGLTYNAEHEVYAWHRHDTRGEFKSICSLPCPADDRLFVLTKRGERYLVEAMAQQYTDDEDESYCGVYLDSAQTLRSPEPVSIVGGLEHLEGQEVTLIADGKIYSRKVENGLVSLDEPARNIVAGLDYNAELETMPLEVDGQQGSSSGRKKKISAINLHLKNSFTVEAGTDFEHMEEIKGKKSKGKLQAYSGVQRVVTGALGNNLATACLRSGDPYPLTVLAIIPELAIY